MFKYFFDYLLALLRHYQVLLTGGFITAAMGAWEHWSGSQIPKAYYGIIACVFLFIAAFRAWQVEYVKNRDGPQIVMEWNSSRKSGSHDSITLRNIGKESAFNVRLGSFSWPELSWHRTIEVQSLDHNKDVTQEAQFSVDHKEAGFASTGYMHLVLESFRICFKG